MLFVNANNLISIVVTLLVGATILMYVINAFGKPGYYLGHCVPGIRYTCHSGRKIFTCFALFKMYTLLYDVARDSIANNFVTHWSNATLIPVKSRQTLGNSRR